MNKIRYIAGYKYQLHETYSIKLPFSVPEIGIIDHSFLNIIDGALTIMQGYAWDGPSGPTIDTNDFMRGSLVHDALYQLMREGLLDQSFRQLADALLHSLCIEDGMSKFRAAYVYNAVHEFGAKNATKQNPEILEAP